MSSWLLNFDLEANVYKECIDSFLYIFLFTSSLFSLPKVFNDSFIELFSFNLSFTIWWNKVSSLYGNFGVVNSSIIIWSSSSSCILLLLYVLFIDLLLYVLFVISWVISWFEELFIEWSIIFISVLKLCPLSFKMQILGFSILKVLNLL